MRVFKYLMRITLLFILKPVFVEGDRVDKLLSYL